jgi:hypothetical protein
MLMWTRTTKGNSHVQAMIVFGNNLCTLATTPLEHTQYRKHVLYRALRVSPSANHLHLLSVTLAKE